MAGHQAPGGEIPASPRLDQLNAHAFRDRAEELLATFCHAAEVPAPPIFDILILGSALTERFVPGQSDLDFIYVAEDRPAKSLKRGLWQYINDAGQAQTALAEMVGFRVGKIDCNGLVQYSAVEQTIHDEFVYSLYTDGPLRPDQVATNDDPNQNH